MFRYEVTSSDRTDIENVVGRPIFYEDNSKHYIDAPNHIKSIQYYDSGTDTVKSETLDQICQALYSEDFADRSTESEYEIIDQVQLTKVDPDTGAPLISTKKLRDGHYFQYREIEFETSKLNSVHDRDKAGNDLGTTTIKFLDSNRDELVSPTQETLDSSCAYTVCRFQPSGDWGIRGVTTGHKAATNENIYVNADVNILVHPAPVYLTLPQANGGMNLYYVAPYEHRGVSEDNFVYFTSNDFIEWDITHPTGHNHRIQCILQLSLPIPGA